MHGKNQFRNLLLRTISCAAMAAIAIVFALTVVASQPAQAQTFKEIYAFTGGKDGGNPYAGLTRDGAGNLYGTAATGGIGGGTAFKLTHKGSTWVFNLLYSFDSFGGGSDGTSPHARVISSLISLSQVGGYEIRLRPRLDRRPDPCPATRRLEASRLQNRFQGRGTYQARRRSALPCPLPQHIAKPATPSRFGNSTG